MALIHSTGQMISGAPCSPGVAIARALVLKNEALTLDQRVIQADEVEHEIERFRASRTRSLEELQRIVATLEGGDASDQHAIFEGHLVLLDDEELENDVIAQIREKHIRADLAVHQAIEQYAEMVAALEDPYLRERSADCRDVGSRLIRNLLGIEAIDLASIDEEVILVSHDLAPSQTAQINTAFVKGFVTDIGGRTSHSAIMARSLELPAIVGTGNGSAVIHTGDLVAIDAEHNEVWINPDGMKLAELHAARQHYLDKREVLSELRDLPAITRDGHRVELCANIGSARDTDGALRNGAEGIGLFRSEFLFMDRTELPGEEEQYRAYSAVARSMGTRSVIVRTMDIGGDKELPYLQFPKEMNPFLGWRAVRIFFDRHDIMQTQLRAILRASAHGKLRIMFPMICAVEEIRTLKREVEKLKANLLAEGLPFDESIEIGIMIETPAAAVLARHLAREVDFFSIGTNDLTQYTLAVDRGNETIAHLYQSLSPAVLSLLRQVIDAAHAEGKWVGMCGELASDDRAIPMLLGMGLDEFSMGATAIPAVKKIIRGLLADQARALADRVVSCATTDEVAALLDEFSRNSGQHDRDVRTSSAV